METQTNIKFTNVINAAINNETVRLETITPEYANSLLKNLDSRQRKIKISHVQRLESELKNGRFVVNNDAIVIIKGKLANGQHRVTAIANTNIAADMMVLRTDNEEVWNTIDGQIKTRSVADTLGTEFEYSGLLGAIGKLILRYDLKQIYLGGGSRFTATRTDLIDYIKANIVELTEAAKEASNGYSSGQPCVTESMAAAFLVIASRNGNDKKDATEFIRYIYQGKCEFPMPSYVNDLREKLIKERNNKRHKIQQGFIFALLIRAYNSYKNNVTNFKSTAIHGKKFPKFYYENIGVSVDSTEESIELS